MLPARSLAPVLALLAACALFAACHGSPATSRSPEGDATTEAVASDTSPATSRAPEGAEPGPTDAPALDGPTVIALGTVQDGGLPHAGCSCERCEAARHDPSRRRSVASLGVVIPAADGSPPAVYLIDATPDVTEQLHRLRPYRHGPPGRVDRTPLAGILLTHAHIGHYLGLAHFGFEVMHASGVSAFCTPRMAAFLRSNAPWSQLVAKRELEIVETEPGRAVELGGGVTFTPIQVPHRDELSDTVGYLLRGPRSTLFYVPDTDSWRAWERPLTTLLADERVDVLLPDGTFYSLDELPGRDVGSIGHPLIRESLDLLGEPVAAGRLAVYFTHLNHSNPALEPDSAARREIQERGFGVLAEGQRFPL